MIIEFFIYTLIVIGFAYYVFRIVVRNDYLHKSKLSPLAYLLEILVFGIHANLIYLFIPLKWPDLPPFPDNLILNLLLFSILFLGLVVLIVSWFGLGTGPSLGLDKNQLRTSGIYKYSRNPQLVGYGIIILVLALLLFSWYALGWFAQYLVMSFLMIKSEEEYLGMKYGEEYERYKSIVPRVIKLF